MGRRRVGQDLWIDASQFHAFLSHSSADKPTVRRVARRLGHRGVRVWLDESELRVGDRLPQLFRDRITAASCLVVYASASAAASRWVTLEIEAARAGGTIVIPLFPDSVKPWGALADQKGLTLKPREFERTMDELASAILAASDDNRDISARDDAVLRVDLGLLRAEHPAVVHSVVDAIDDTWRIKTVDPADYDPIETLLWIEWELADATRRDGIARAAAALYRLGGVGYEVLDRYLRQLGDHNSTLSELCQEQSSPDLISPAFRLLELGPPSDLHVRWLLTSNIEAMTAAEVDNIVRFAVRPIAENDSLVERMFLADYLFRRRPHDDRLNSFWVRRAYAAVYSSRDLFLTLADADRDALTQYIPTMTALQSRVRNLARSADLRDRYQALRLVGEAREATYPHTLELHDEAARAPGSAEWKSSVTPAGFREAYLAALRAIDQDGLDISALEALLEAIRAADGHRGAQSQH